MDKQALGIRNKQTSFKSAQSFKHLVDKNISKQDFSKASRADSRKKAINTKISEEAEDVMLTLGDQDSKFDKPQPSISLDSQGTLHSNNKAFKTMGLKSDKSAQKIAVGSDYNIQANIGNYSSQPEIQTDRKNLN